MFRSIMKIYKQRTPGVSRQVAVGIVGAREKSWESASWLRQWGCCGPMFQGCFSDILSRQGLPQCSADFLDNCFVKRPRFILSLHTEGFYSYFHTAGLECLFPNIPIFQGLAEVLHLPQLPYCSQLLVSSFSRFFDNW